MFRVCVRVYLLQFCMSVCVVCVCVCVCHTHTMFTGGFTIYIHYIHLSEARGGQSPHSMTTYKRFCQHFEGNLLYVCRKNINLLSRKCREERYRILCFVDRASLYNLVNKAKLMHNFLSMFISFLYRFRATVCPSSGEITVSMQHLVFVTLCG
jgi:hypothetical protein